MIRALVTGISQPLASKLASTLEQDPDVDYIGGVDASPSTRIIKMLEVDEIDTVVHTGLSSRQFGVGRSLQKENNVMGAAQLFAACARVPSVKRVVLRSTTAVYGSEAGDPSILTEEYSERSAAPAGYGKDASDVEDFARHLARRRPDVCVCTLRMANILGVGSNTNITQFFSLPVIPTGAGFDPRLQFLHFTDAVNVLRMAALDDHPGTFNVAGDGVMYLSQAIRLARKMPLTVPAELAQSVGDILRRLSLIDFPTDQIALLRNGRVVSTDRLRDDFGFEPQFSTLETFKDFVKAAS